MAAEGVSMSNSPEFPGFLSIPGQPVDALPGSPDKIQALTERAARGEPLFHPQDTPGIKSTASHVPAPVTWKHPESA